jgi:hypothetical protein
MFLVIVLDSTKICMTEPLSLSVVSEAVSNQLNGTVESTSNVNGSPPPTSTVMEDVTGLTLTSDEESSPLQKQPKNQRNVSINIALEILNGTHHHI